MRVSPYEIVATSSDGAPMTLSQVFDEMGIRPYDLNLDSLGMHADPSIFCRFDKFNLKYNPLGKSRLREIFLKTENRLKVGVGLGLGLALALGLGLGSGLESNPLP